MSKYQVVKDIDTGEVLILVDGKVRFTAKELGLEETPAPKSRTKKTEEQIHQLKVEGDKPETAIVYCKCGATGYVCKGCLKVFCDEQTPTFDGKCPDCRKKAIKVIKVG